MRRRIYRPTFIVINLLLVLLLGTLTASAFQLGARPAKDWIDRLESPERIAGLKIPEVIARMALKPGMVIADLGAGTGVFAREFSKAVGAKGKVYAVDIDNELLDYVRERAKKENQTNIRAVLGKFEDPAIPARDVDIAFFHDVFHHIEKRQPYLKALSTYIKPNGLIALIEMDKNDPNTSHRADPHMLVDRKDVDKWMAEAGFFPVKEHNDLFPGTKWFVIYQKR
jgi:2-polyprenyl-3-methyl-5-hydroxy-6-metoxy-1,4-benzoquinol methylase